MNCRNQGREGGRDCELQGKGFILHINGFERFFKFSNHHKEREMGNCSKRSMQEERYRAIEKNEIMPFATTWMDLEIIVLSKSEKDKDHIIPLICNLKNNTSELIAKHKLRHSKFIITKGGRGRMDKLGI